LGQNRSRLVVVGERMQLLGSRPAAAAPSGQATTEQADVVQEVPRDTVPEEPPIGPPGPPPDENIPF